ncbi:HIT family protein [Holophaga foetida]|uniref:HIT family protein n=1 Tax=Holophaga foetida TaxID=35839 RepID=UPI00024732D6|nr:hypothetical protein [Holophaga foetida]
MSQVLRVFEDEFFTLDGADYCAIPGYLILRCKGAATSAGELSEEEAARFGVLYAKAVKAIEELAGADRVYTLVFAEMDRRFHVHLFPRTRWMLLDYWKHHGDCQAGPANGPLLFEWARTTYTGQLRLPVGAPSVEDVLERLRAALS